MTRTFDRVLVTGGCGFIGSHLVRRLLREHPALEVVTLDALTYAGRRENLEEALELAPPAGRGIRDAGHRRGRRGLRRDRQRRRRDARRPLDPGRRRVPGDERHRHQAPARPGAGGRPALPAGVDRRGLRRRRGPAPLVEETSPARARTRPPRRRATCWCSPTRAPSASTPRSRAAPTPTARSSSRRSSSRSSPPTCWTASRCPSTATACRCGRCSSSRTTRRHRPRAARGRRGEAYNVGAEHEVPNIETTRRLLALTGRDESLITYVADRPGHDRRYSMTAASCAALGWERSVSFDDGPRADRRLVPRPPRVVGADQVRRVRRLPREALRQGARLEAGAADAAALDPVGPATA